ncbi:hypothetical protein CORC01_00003 [Colletotrichum orchidophilum]|uniref:IRG-type G domain-containing protein n=1 Tax=Colletotrichum orchidophilum TaxID=1209926 RepID=A0A1G4BSW4_9PEZI|nr:uncharacterized protein CORC01_00003 [Colletotrichum orchidophilum]OHF04532.1 hypothetical protein CORC01_00003 [Colletotrichum orchidophilum]
MRPTMKSEDDARPRSRPRSPNPEPSRPETPADNDAEHHNGNWSYHVKIGTPPGGYRLELSLVQNLAAIAGYSVAMSILQTLDNARAARERQRQREAEKRRADAEDQERRERERREALERHMRDLGIDLANLTISDEDISAARADVGYQVGARNIVIAGSLNSGKSSLLNALRDRTFGDEDYAPTGASEVTQERHRYVDPIHNGFVWYDSPGAGTADVQVLQVCHALRTPWISVRTKRDMHIGNFQLERGCSPAEARTLFLSEVESDVARFRQQTDASATGFTEQFRDYVVSAPGIRAAVRGGTSPTDPINAFTDEMELLRYIELAEQG